MADADDPFDRAVRRLMPSRSRSGAIRLVIWSYAGFGALWAAVLAVHWRVFGDPRWLAVAHTVIFALAVAYALCALVVLIAMRRRRPEWFEVDDL